MRIISATVVLTTLLANAPARAGKTENCERPEYAQQYAARFTGELNVALNKIKDQDSRRRSKLDEMKAALIEATGWTAAETSVFMIKASLTDEDAKVLEAERKKAASDFKVQLLALEGIPVIAGGSKAEQLRATCLLGPAAIAKADVLLAATERAWNLIESKVAAETDAKIHTAAPVPRPPANKESTASRPHENSGTATSTLAQFPNELPPPKTGSDSVNTEKWHASMGCRERVDGKGKKSIEEQFTMEKRGGDVTLARRSATANEVLSGRIQDNVLKLTGMGNMINASHSWTLYFSGPFSEGASEWSGTGEMNGGAGVVRQCVLKMSRS